MSAFICLLTLLLIGAGLISYVGSAKAEQKLVLTVFIMTKKG